MSVNIYDKVTGELIQIAGNANGVIDDANVSNKTTYSSSKIKEMSDYLNGKIDDNTTQLNSTTQNITEANNNISNLSSTKAEKTDLDNTNIKVNQNTQELEVQKARIDNFTKLTEGSTTGDAELIDGRIAIDGITYENIGTAIRTQMSKTNNNQQLFSDVLFDKEVVEFKAHDNFWIYGSNIEAQTGYKCISFDVKPNTIYKIERNKGNVLGVSFSTSGFVANSKVLYYNRVDGNNIIFKTPNDVGSCIVFVGKLDDTVFNVFAFNNNNSKTSSEYTEIPIETIEHENSWLYVTDDGKLLIETEKQGYKSFSIPLENGKTYKIKRSKYGRIIAGVNISGFVNGYLIPNKIYNDNGIEFEYTNINNDPWLHICIGNDNASINVYEIINNNKQLYKLSKSNDYINYEIGSVDTNTGINKDSATRIRSEFIRVSKDDEIRSYIYDMVILFYDKKKNYLSNSYTNYQDWIKEYKIIEDGYIKIVLRKNKNEDTFKHYEVNRAEKSISISSYTKTVEQANSFSMARISALEGFESLEDMNEDLVYAQTYKKRGKIRKVGNKIVAADGNEILMTGIGTHSLSEYNNLYTSEVFKTLVYNGINCLRVSVYLSDKQFANSEGRVGKGWINHSETIKDIIDKLIPIATEEGLYIILDWHSYHAIDGGDVTKYQSQSEEFFRYFSSKYKDYGNIMYELHNEPYQNSAQQLLSGVQENARIIRENVPDAILICGHGNDWDTNAVDTMNKLFNIDNNLDIFISPHIYTGEQSVDYIREFTTKNAPIFVTEWGNSSLTGDESPNDAVANEMFEYCHTNHINYCLWKLTYQNMDTAILKSDLYKNMYTYQFGGFKNSDLSHNGKLYFKNIRNFRFKI